MTTEVTAFCILGALLLGIKLGWSIGTRTAAHKAHMHFMDVLDDLQAKYTKAQTEMEKNNGSK